MSVLHEASYKVGVGRNPDHLRVYMATQKLAVAGLVPGGFYEPQIDPEARSITLQPTRRSKGKNVFKVSRKRPNGNATGVVVPVIDVPAVVLQQAFPDGAQTVHVVMETGRVTIKALPNDDAARERLLRLKDKLDRGTPLETGELCAGGGIMTSAIAEGLNRAGVETHCAFFVDHAHAPVRSAARNIPQVEPDTRTMMMGIEQIDPRTLPKVEILTSGLPCTGASTQGRAKNRNKTVEDHDSAGHLFIPFLNIIQAVQPAIVVLENVIQFEKSMAMEMIKRMLKIWGYSINMGRLNGNESGVLERRTRMVMVATTGGIPVQIEGLPLEVAPSNRLNDILEDRPPEGFKWVNYATPAQMEKRDRDQLKGNNFNNIPLCHGNMTSIPCNGANYYKNQPSSTRLPHPTDPTLCRTLTPLEHARGKGIPESAINGCTDTLAQMILGNSVIWPGFVAIGRAIGVALLEALRIARPTPTINMHAMLSDWSEPANLVFANHPGSEFHPSEPSWMNDSRFNGTAGSQ